MAFLPSRVGFWHGRPNSFRILMSKIAARFPSSRLHDTHLPPEIVVTIGQNYREVIHKLVFILFAIRRDSIPANPREIIEDGLSRGRKGIFFCGHSFQCWLVTLPAFDIITASTLAVRGWPTRLVRSGANWIPERALK